MSDLISCTPAEYHAVQQSLASLRATLEKAAAAPVGSKLHRGIAYFQRGITRYEAFLASHAPVEGCVPADRPYMEDDGIIRDK